MLTDYRQFRHNDTVAGGDAGPGSFRGAQARSQSSETHQQEGPGPRLGDGGNGQRSTIECVGLRREWRRFFGCRIDLVLQIKNLSVTKTLKNTPNARQVIALYFS
jgi:hypothetical protein